MKTLGLDLGISSIGWALIESDNEDEGKIIDLGIRIFPSGQAIKQGKPAGPPAKPRREARLSRRTTRRKRARLAKIKKLLRDYNLESSFYNKKMINVWELRAKALKEKIPNDDFFRILIHIAKHRGYMLSLEPDNGDDGDKKDKERKKIKKAISETKKNIEDSNYQTYGEYVYNDALKHDKPYMRNRQGEYRYFPTIDLIKDEIDIIFKKQAQFGNNYAANGLKSEYLKIMSSVKEPKSFENMIGSCQFFKDEKRAPKHSHSAERFVLLTSILNAVVIDEGFKETKIIDIKPLKDIIEFAYTSSIIVTYKQLRKFLSIEEKSRFKGIDYDKKRKTRRKIKI